MIFRGISCPVHDRVSDLALDTSAAPKGPTVSLGDFPRLTLHCWAISRVEEPHSLANPGWFRNFVTHRQGPMMRYQRRISIVVWGLHGYPKGWGTVEYTTTDSIGHPQFHGTGTDPWLIPGGNGPARGDITGSQVTARGRLYPGMKSLPGDGYHGTRPLTRGRSGYPATGVAWRVVITRGWPCPVLPPGSSLGGGQPCCEVTRAPTCSMSNIVNGARPHRTLVPSVFRPFDAAREA